MYCDAMGTCYSGSGEVCGADFLPRTRMWRLATCPFLFSSFMHWHEWQLSRVSATLHHCIIPYAQAFTTRLATSSGMGLHANTRLFALGRPSPKGARVLSPADDSTS